MDRDAKRSEKTARRKKQLRIRIFLGALFLILGIAAAVWLIIRYTPTNQRMSLEEYFGPMEADEAAIVIQDQILTDQRALVRDGHVYLPHELVRDSLNERFFWDARNGQVLFTTASQTFEIPVESASYKVIDGALDDDPSSESSFEEVIALRADSGDLYFSLAFLAQYTDIAWTYEEDTRHVFIRNQWGDTLTADSLKEAAVRYTGGIKSPIVTDLLKGDQVIVLEQGEHWLKVLTQNGFVGWVKSNRMTEPVTVNQEHEGFTPVAYPSIKMDDKVSLIWHMVTTTGDNKAFPDATASMTGINVISPTWFSLTDNEGNVESLGSKTYVEEAHNKGLQVWGLVDDFSPDMDNSVMLSSTAARRNCISQLIGYARTLGMDGINIDFEHIDPDDAYTYTEFVRELSIACRSHSLVLSVDTYPPYDFNAYLNRKEIAAVSDYLINMGYDEHYVGSESAGSVASFGYEARALSTLLQSGIPADKLISAIPFYTRIWYTSTDEAGTAYINSEELSMNAVSATLESWSLTPQWDPSTAQNYISWYTDDGVLCEIWIEDADSLLRKALLVSSNDLAGCAIWALGFQDDSVWKVVSENISLPKEEAATLLSQLQELDQAEAQKEVPDTEVPGTESE